MSATESENNSQAGQGAVVLDIGGDIGALVVSMPSEMEGLEIEIRLAGIRTAGHVPHVAVVARPTSVGVAYSAVFPALAAGSYDLNQRHFEQTAVTAEVIGAHVTYSTWTGLVPAT